MNGTPKGPDAFSAPNESQLTPTSLPSLTPPEQVPAHNGAGWEFLQGMDITMQGHCQCLGRQMQTWKGSYPLGSRRGILPQQLVANAQPGLKRPDWRCPSSGNEQIDLLFDEMDGSDNTQREQIQAFDQMMMSSVPHPYIDTPEPWVPPPPTTFEDVFRQQDEEDGVELGPYSSMLFDQEHSTSSRG
ncbi:hypothetical protein CFIO01_09897 [Colletotrichum fioriniae PJ7]|uniref:Uncharacterized protein n=1 Tax=Colletotrichum fioriniae PJ7 TaxID=1445577 RepID=A0A010QVP4_9PEZI|nr:hypothetical protein CFIO01_09897 [Colletotrichum fioriniae PJ7]